MESRTKQGTYYLGRVIKLGILDTGMVVKALKDPVKIEAGEHCWTITSFKEFKENNKLRFIYGKLTKYKPTSKVDVVDEESHQETTEQIENATVASSSFVYIPEFSGIAYLHIWNQIQQEAFIRRFSELVCKKHQNIFVECIIDAISDLSVFYKRVVSISNIKSIEAKVNPPNPLFGPLWKSLHEYLKKRNLKELKISESADKDKEIKTDLLNAIKSAEAANVSNLSLDITDSALLMAADGYGQAKITGVSNQRIVTVRTSDAMQNFRYDTDPNPEMLFNIAHKMLKGITDKRHMQHDK